MKRMFWLLIIFGMGSVNLTYLDGLTKQSWELNLITLNSDTIFYRGNPDYTYLYNCFRNKDWMKNKKDSMQVLKVAKEKYQNSESMNIKFNIDSSYIMTKMRSGGRIYQTESDTGFYRIKNDTLFMTNTTRNNYKQIFLLNKSKDCLFFKDETPEFNVYWEFRKGVK